ncbi:MAG: ATP-dependent zinc metalloprotease FtsH, partial [Vicinamibacteria bacterium]
LTTGAHDDLEKATELARKMVCEWGMSEKMGPLTFGRREEQVFLGRDIARHQDYSEDTAIKIDQEVKRIVEQAYGRARTILSENRPLLEKVAEALLEREVLDAEEVRMLMEGLPLKPRESVEEIVAEKPESKEAKEKEKERKAALTPPILQNPGSVTQS